MQAKAQVTNEAMVAPHAGAWIEIGWRLGLGRHRFVAPHAGAWIEIPTLRRILWTSSSLPMRERGLKLVGSGHRCPFLVAPHAGAWIDILAPPLWTVRWRSVAPHAGAWIEISGRRFSPYRCYVAPHAGAWIEISKMG